jgi:hypothetical protein
MLAYIDPGIGSIIVQASVAAAAGIAVVARLYWDRLLKFFGIRKKFPCEAEADPVNPFGEKK